MSKHYHHGRTPAAWTGSIIAAIAFIIGSAGFLMGPNWTVIWVGAALLVISVIAGGALRKLGYGQG